MAAGINDKFSRTYNAANPNVARVTSSRSAAGTSLSCDNLAGWPTDTLVQFSTYKINTSNEVVAGTQIDWKGIVSGNTIGTLTRITGAADTGSAVGDVVEMNPTASWADNLVQGILTEHTQTGTHVMSRPKVTTSIDDTNGNELFKVTATSSAVNELTIANAATGAGPTLSATGGDTNIDINFTPKGTGIVKIGGNPIGSGAWTSWTPSYTNLTVGNGTVVAKYQQIGKTVNFRWSLVCGSTTTISSDCAISLPVTANSDYSTSNVRTTVGKVFAYDVGTSNNVGVFVTIASATSGTMFFDDSTAPRAGTGFPFTVGSGDTVTVTGSYEAA